MNLFNRLLLVLLCLTLIAGSVATIGLAWAAPDESIEWLADAAVWLDNHNTDGTRILISLAAIAVGLVAFLVVVFELLPRSKAEVKVTGLRVGDAVLTTAAIGQRIEEAVNQVPDVSDVRAVVHAKRKGVLVNLDLHVDPQANLAAVTDEACEAARDILTDKVHVELLAPPRVRLHYRELRLQGRGSRRATAAASAVPVPAGLRTATLERPEETPVADTIVLTPDDAPAVSEQVVVIDDIPDAEEPVTETARAEEVAILDDAAADETPVAVEEAPADDTPEQTARRVRA